MQKLLSVMLALAMCVSLFGCGASKPVETTAPAAQETNPVETNAPAAETVEISLWTYPIGGWGNQDTVNGLISAFEAANPGIKVTVEYLDYTNGDDKVNTAIEGGAAPDLIMEGPERLVANWGEKGLMVDLADLLDDTDLAELNPAAIKACYATNGAVYEYPLVMTAHCMAINKTVFEAAGAMQYIDEETHTWKSAQAFLDAIQAVYDNGQENVLAVYCGGQGGDQGTRHLISNIAGGTPWSNPEHTKFTVANEANAEALAKLYAQDGVNFDASIVGGDEINLFLQGQLAVATCWNATLAGNNADIIAANDWELFPMAFASDNTPVLAGGFYCLGIFDNADDAKDEAANLFIEFIGSDEMYKEAVLAAGQWATRDIGNIYEGDELMTTYGMFAPMFGDYYQITTNWTQARTEWWNMLQRVMDTDGSVEAILAEMQAAQDASNAG